MDKKSKKKKSYTPIEKRLKEKIKLNKISEAKALILFGIEVEHDVVKYQMYNFEMEKSNNNSKIAASIFSKIYKKNIKALMPQIKEMIKNLKIFSVFSATFNDSSSNTKSNSLVNNDIFFNLPMNIQNDILDKYMVFDNDLECIFVYWHVLSKALTLYETSRDESSHSVVTDKHFRDLGAFTEKVVERLMAIEKKHFFDRHEHNPLLEAHFNTLNLVRLLMVVEMLPLYIRFLKLLTRIDEYAAHFSTYFTHCFQFIITIATFIPPLEVCIVPISSLPYCDTLYDKGPATIVSQWPLVVGLNETNCELLNKVFTPNLSKYAATAMKEDTTFVDVVKKESKMNGQGIGYHSNKNDETECYCNHPPHVSLWRPWLLLRGLLKQVGPLLEWSGYLENMSSSNNTVFEEASAAQYISLMQMYAKNYRKADKQEIGLVLWTGLSEAIMVYLKKARPSLFRAAEEAFMVVGEERFDVFFLSEEPWSCIGDSSELIHIDRELYKSEMLEQLEGDGPVDVEGEVAEEEDHCTRCQGLFVQAAALYGSVKGSVMTWVTENVEKIVRTRLWRFDRLFLFDLYVARNSWEGVRCLGPLTLGEYGADECDLISAVIALNNAGCMSATMGGPYQKGVLCLKNLSDRLSSRASASSLMSFDPHCLLGLRYSDVFTYMCVHLLRGCLFRLFEGVEGPQRQSLLQAALIFQQIPVKAQPAYLGLLEVNLSKGGMIESEYLRQMTPFLASLELVDRILTLARGALLTLTPNSLEHDNCLRCIAILGDDSLLGNCSHLSTMSLIIDYVERNFESLKRLLLSSL